MNLDLIKPMVLIQGKGHQKKCNEVYFHWSVGDVCSYVPEKQAAQWINEVTDPLQYAQPGDRLRIEVVYQQHYAELEFPLS